MCVSELSEDLRTRLGALIHCNFLLGCLPHTGVILERIQRYTNSFSLYFSSSFSILSLFVALALNPPPFSLFVSKFYISVYTYSCTFLHLPVYFSSFSPISLFISSLSLLPSLFFLLFCSYILYIHVKFSISLSLCCLSLSFSLSIQFSISLSFFFTL